MNLVLIGQFLRKWWPLLVGAILVALLVLVYLHGRSTGRQGEVINQQEAEIEIRGNVNRANETAADKRVQDAIETAEQQKELENAIEATTDPDRRRVLRGCVIMRQQGQDTSRIPACS